MKKNILFQRITFITLCLSAQTAISQVKDAGLWENVCLEKKITPKINFHLNHEGRINENMTRFYYAYADMGVTYIFNKHFDVMLDYVFIEKRKLDNFWYTHHQAYVAFVFKQRVGSFKFYDRIMPQIGYANIYSSENGMVPTYHLRNKVTIKYNHYSRFTYYIASEIYYRLSSYKASLPEGAQSQFDRIRYFAGCFYELNKRSNVELYYLYEDNFHTSNPTDNFVIGIGFDHKF